MMGKSSAIVWLKLLPTSKSRHSHLTSNEAIFQLQHSRSSPGFVKSRLTGWRGRVDIEESCTGMVNIIEKLVPEMSGSFLDWKGETIIW
jgi:hypothetical protein